MARFDPAQYAASVTALLCEPRLMPLDRGEPNRTAFDQLRGLDEARLFDGQPVRHRELARACLAGLWLYHDFLDEAHRISQSLHGREGSYWHGSCTGARATSPTPNTGFAGSASIQSMKR
jgi:hypothetical protein